MSKAIDDGGPAFPSHVSPRGMTLRDWLAGHASEEDINSHLPSTIGELRRLKKLDGIHRNREWAKFAYADAMLKARKGGWK